MKQVRLDRGEFLAAVQKNRDSHRAVFEEALEGYRERWIELSEGEFAMYVMDQWSWKDTFARTTSLYTRGLL